LGTAAKRYNSGYLTRQARGVLESAHLLLKSVCEHCLPIGVTVDWNVTNSLLNKHAFPGQWNERGIDRRADTMAS
jgi:hypothetical protein